MSAVFIGLDLAKSVFQVYGVDINGREIGLSTFCGTHGDCLVGLKLPRLSRKLVKRFCQLSGQLAGRGVGG
jgi:hypothetical protein